jgi:hypothetical protein
MELTRRVVTNVAKPEGTYAPMGQLIRCANIRARATATSRPRTPTRSIRPPSSTSATSRGCSAYVLLPFLDGWTNVFAVPGKPTTGTEAQTYVVTGPGWSGAVPAGMTELKSPTALVWLLGRIYCTGTPKAYAAVHALQDAFKLQPLSTWGKTYAPPEGEVDPAIDMKTAVRDQVNRLSTAAYLTLLAELMKRNPPAAADASALKRFEAIGLAAGKSFDVTTLDARWDARLPQLSYDRIMLHLATLKRENGWLFTTQTGLYGTDYPITSPRPGSPSSHPAHRRFRLGIRSRRTRRRSRRD